MTPPNFHVRVIQAVPGSDADLRSGLVAYLIIELDGTLLIDGFTIRRTIDGRTTVSFPRPKDHRGNRVVVIQPVDADARRRIEAAILEQVCFDSKCGGVAR